MAFELPTEWNGLPFNTIQSVLCSILPIASTQFRSVTAFRAVWGPIQINSITRHPKPYSVPDNIQTLIKGLSTLRYVNFSFFSPLFLLIPRTYPLIPSHALPPSTTLTFTSHHSTRPRLSPLRSIIPISIPEKQSSLPNLSHLLNHIHPAHPTAPLRTLPPSPTHIPLVSPAFPLSTSPSHTLRLCPPLIGRLTTATPGPHMRPPHVPESLIRLSKANEESWLAIVKFNHSNS